MYLIHVNDKNEWSILCMSYKHVVRTKGLKEVGRVERSTSLVNLRVPSRYFLEDLFLDFGTGLSSEVVCTRKFCSQIRFDFRYEIGVSRCAPGYVRPVCVDFPRGSTDCVVGLAGGVERSLPVRN